MTITIVVLFPPKMDHQHCAGLSTMYLLLANAIIPLRALLIPPVVPTTGHLHEDNSNTFL